MTPHPTLSTRTREGRVANTELSTHTLTASDEQGETQMRRLIAVQVEEGKEKQFHLAEGPMGGGDPTDSISHSEGGDQSRHVS